MFPMKAEFVAASNATSKLLGARELLMDLGMAITTPMCMVYNEALIKHLGGEASPSKAKHMDIRVKFVCEQARRGIIIPRYVPSGKMVAKISKKALDFRELADMRPHVGLQ